MVGQSELCCWTALCLRSLCRRRHQQCADNAAVFAQCRRDDVGVDIGFDFGSCNVAGEPVLGACAYQGEQARLLHHAAAEDDALREEGESELRAESAEVVVSLWAGSLSAKQERNKSV